MKFPYRLIAIYVLLLGVYLFAVNLPTPNTPPTPTPTPTWRGEWQGGGD